MTITTTDTIECYESLFANHVVKDKIVTDTFGTWLLKRPGHGEFWCRITAAEGHLTVVGDFDPITFAYGSQDSPLGYVRWIGGGSTLDYLVGKARIGSGSHAVMQADLDHAGHWLRDALTDAQAPGGDGNDVKILQAGLDRYEDIQSQDQGWDDEWALVEIRQSMSEVAAELNCYDAYEGWADMGRNVRVNVLQAIAAVRRLWALEGARALERSA